MTIIAGKKFGKSVSVCGEIAGDTKLTKLLLGMGLRQFSMHPSNILSVKKQILQSQLSVLSGHAKKVLNTKDLEKIEPLVAKFNLH